VGRWNWKEGRVREVKKMGERMLDRRPPCMPKVFHLKILSEHDHESV